MKKTDKTKIKRIGKKNKKRSSTVAADVEESLQLKGQLESALRNFRNFLSKSVESIIVVDMKGKILFANPSASNLMEAPNEEMLGNRLGFPVVPGEKATVSLLRKGGDRSRAEVSVVESEWEGEKCLIVFLRDVTDISKAQTALRLAEMGELTAHLAHEIKNPIQIILNYALFALKEKFENEKVKKYLDVIIDECESMIEIIKRLLTFSKKPEKIKIDIDVNDVLKSVVELMRDQYLFNRIRIVEKYSSEKLITKITKSQLQELFVNILINAAQAMPNGGTVTTATLVQGKYVRVDISDTGPGISEENRKQIFTPFFTTKERGTGLGLSACFGIVNANEGQLLCESEIDKGVTFTILLPLKRKTGKKKSKPKS